MYSKLQYISQGNTPSEHITHIEQALEAGCNWIQLRLKNCSDEDIEATAFKVKTLCDHYKATFILNDHPSIALKVKADGVHLGLSDMLVTEARAILGNDKIIGGTANTVEHVIQRINE